MAKVIIAREEDKGSLSSPILIRFVMCLVGGFAGIPAGALLSALMMFILKETSANVIYCFYGDPIILGMLIAFLYIRKDTIVKNHTLCTKCKHKMEPATPEDTIFHIPAEHGDTYENPIAYLAKNMVRVSSIAEMMEEERFTFHLDGYTADLNASASKRNTKKQQRNFPSLPVQPLRNPERL